MKRYLLIACFVVGCGSVSGGASDSGSNTMVTITVAITGTGTVTSNPAGITCTPNCTLAVERGTQVTLTAATGTLLSWGGACSGAGDCQVTATDDVAIAANFDVVETLTVVAAGGNAGEITSVPTGITCPGTCTAVFPRGTTVALTFASADPNEQVDWSGACVGSGACGVTLDAPKTVDAAISTLLIDTAPVVSLASPRTNGGATAEVSAATTTVITGLGVDVEITGAATQLKFVIFDATSLAVLYVSLPVSAPLGRAIIKNTTMNFTMAATTKYQIGAVVAGSANFEFDGTAATSHGLTTFTSNGNPTTFATPVLPAGNGADDARVQITGYAM